MMKITAFVLVGTLAFCAPASASDLLFGSWDNIGQIDPVTGALSNVNTLNGDDYELYGMATQPGTDTLFGITSSANWISTADASTGLVTRVVEMSSGGVMFASGDSTWASGLTFQDDGTLWGIVGYDGGDALPGGAIFTVDLGTGVATDSGFMPVGQGGQALEYNPDDGLLYHFYNDNTGGEGNTFLRTLNLITGAATNVPLTGDDFGAVNGLAYAGGGMFYAYDYNPDRLVSITTGGVATIMHNLVGAEAISLTMSTYVPEPGTALLLGVGVLAMMRRRR